MVSMVVYDSKGSGSILRAHKVFAKVMSLQIFIPFFPEVIPRSHSSESRLQALDPRALGGEQLSVRVPLSFRQSIVSSFHFCFLRKHRKHCQLVWKILPLKDKHLF